MIKIKSFEERTPFGVRFSPHNPIALAPLMPDIIAGGVGVLSSLLGGIFGRKSQSDTNAMNLQIARENNQMQLQAMREQNAFNERASIDAFNRENAYNSPYAQAQRMLDAGFSPSVALGSGTIQSSIGNQTVPTSSGLPSFVTPNLTAPPSVMVGAIDGISKLSSAVAQIAQAKKTNKEASWIDAEAEANVKNLFADLKYKEVETSYQEFRQSVDKVFLPFERAMGMRRLADEIKNLGAQYTILCSQNETEKANKLLKDAERKLTEANEDQVRQSTPIIIQNLKKTGEQIDSVTALNKSQKVNVEHQTEHQKIVNKYADRLESSIVAGNRGQLISTLRQAYRSGHGLYDGIKDFVGTIRENLGLGTDYGTINNIEELADALIKDAAKFDDEKDKK